jgi:hypothetical protein
MKNSRKAVFLLAHHYQNLKKSATLEVEKTFRKEYYGFHQ